MLTLAQWFVETVQAVTKDVDFIKFAAHIHEVNESWQKAIGCWEQIKKLHPNDQDANRQINALSAAGTIKRAGLEDALDKRRRGRRGRRAGRGAARPSSSGSSRNSSRPSSG